MTPSTFDLATASAASFAAHLNPVFAASSCEGGDQLAPLTLAEAVSAPKEGQARPFSLIFHGPLGAALPQLTYCLSHASLGTMWLFLGPVARDAEKVEYEAVFN